MRHAHAYPAVEVPASANVTAVLCQRRSRNPGGSQQADGNQNLSQNQIAKEKARHIVTLLAAYCIEAARIVRDFSVILLAARCIANDKAKSSVISCTPPSPFRPRLFKFSDVWFGRAKVHLR